MRIGVVSYYNSSREFCLITPSGKSRDYDFYAREIWFLVAGLGAPYTGQLVEFDVSPDPNGKLEAVNVRNSRLSPPSTPVGSAAPAVVGFERERNDEA